MNKLRLISILFAGVFPYVSYAEAPPEISRCVACHGEKGNSSNSAYPHLAGQHAAYIKKQLMDFKKGTRKDPVMGAMAKPLTDAQIKAIAEYYSKL